MRRKWLMLGVVLSACMVAAILPRYPKVHTSVVHQHQSYPAENKEITGFDENGVLTSHLPLIVLKADGNVIPGADKPTDQELYCEFSVIDNDSHINRSADTPTQTGKMAINIRGNSSRYFIKKQYAIRTVDEAGLPLKTAFLGMPAETTWVLNGSYIDYSLIRNYMMYNISGEIMDYAPRCRLCEVFITNENGKLEYQGVYTLMEKPKVSRERLNLTPYDPKYTETSFVVQLNKRIDDARIDHLKPDDIDVYPFNLESPDVEKITENSMQYVKNELLQFEKALYDAEYTDNWEKVERYIDLDSFVDYYIINEFFQNYDAGRRSTYLYKNIGGKLSIGPVWDFDSAFNNFTGMEISPYILDMQSTFYYFYLCHDAEIVKRCCERYEELRKTVLSEEYLLKYIDESSMYLGSAAIRNCDKWYDGDYALYYDDIEKMKTFVVERGNWMDEHFEDLTAIVR
ncbi:MAG: CotH kinase family protein [Lachnospiraceae bacterium]|nr:CotH kinase family protein [Lachnospiraceae bacterium]